VPALRRGAAAGGSRRRRGKERKELEDVFCRSNLGMLCDAFELTFVLPGPDGRGERGRKKEREKVCAQ